MNAKGKYLPILLLTIACVMPSCTKEIPEGSFINGFEILEISRKEDSYQLDRKGITKIGTLTRPVTLALKGSGSKLSGVIPGGFLPRKINISYVSDHSINVSIDKKSYRYKKIDLSHLKSEPVAGSAEQFEAFLNGLLPHKSSGSEQGQCHDQLLDHSQIRQAILENIQFAPIAANAFSIASNLFATTYFYRLNRPQQQYEVTIIPDQDICRADTKVCLKAKNANKVLLTASSRTESVTMYFHRFAALRDLEQDYEILDQHINSYDASLQKFICDWDIKI